MPNHPEVEFLALPYDSAGGRSLLHVLIEELQSGSWTSLQCAVAFVQLGGNFPALLRAILAFAHAGHRVQLTFGADRPNDSPGSDYRAIEGILQTLAGERTAEVSLYHEPGRLFHPKLYLFSNECARQAVLIVGSSNWTRGGFVNNIEADLLVRLDLEVPSHFACFEKTQACFREYWREQ